MVTSISRERSAGHPVMVHEIRCFDYRSSGAIIAMFYTGCLLGIMSVAIEEADPSLKISPCAASSFPL